MQSCEALKYLAKALTVLADGGTVNPPYCLTLFVREDDHIPARYFSALQLCFATLSRPATPPCLESFSSVAVVRLLSPHRQENAVE
ncbi:MAG: hypothetical protein OHK0029_34450 [Armatimonadaceae bacterium]